jgi:hypothetical protein
VERRDCEIKRVERNDFKKKRMAGRCCTLYVRGWQGVAVLGTEEGGRTWLYCVCKRVTGHGCTEYRRGWQGVAVLGTEEGGREWLTGYGRGCKGVAVLGTE